jgi:hypothetical protein
VGLVQLLDIQSFFKARILFSLDLEILICTRGKRIWHLIKTMAFITSVLVFAPRHDEAYSLEESRLSK